MNTYSLHRAGARLRLPLVFLIGFLQRTPGLRVVLMAENAFISSPLGAVLKSAAAALASLGAVHSLAGATTYALTSTTASPASATVGQPIGTINFGVSNTTDIGSWVLAGSFPPGLKLSSSDGMAELAAPGVLDATRPGEGGGTDSYGYPIEPMGGVTNTIPVLSGTPTQAGSYTFSLYARQGPLNLVAGPFNYTINVAAAAGGGGTGSGPTFSTQPSGQSANAGGSLTLSASASGSPTFEWQRNGTAVGTGSSLTLNNIQPANTGLYQAVATSGGTTTGSRAAIVGVTSNAKIIGQGTEFANITAPNGNVYDQILLEGAAASVRADDGQILRISFLDMNDDIVQVEISGPGTLSLVLDGVSGPATPVKYNQPTVSYLKGHVGIVLTGATANTNMSVFSVGRANASNQNLFRTDVTYDGFADVAFIAIASADGQFGGLRAANASIWNTKGFTGVYAPGVQFTGPVFINDIDARDNATPVFSIGGSPDVRVAGGDLSQSNGRAVQVDGITALKFTQGSNSHGILFDAQTNHGRLEQNGQDVSGQIVAK